MSFLPARSVGAENGWYDNLGQNYDDIDFKKKKNAKNLCG